MVASCSPALIEGDYWVTAVAESGTNNDSYRTLFTVKKPDVLAVPETSLLLIPIILAVILIIINPKKKKITN